MTANVIRRIVLFPWRLVHAVIRVPLWPLIAGLWIAGIWVACVLARKRRAQLIWGPMPITNNKYWSEAMRRVGWDSVTLMTHHYSISQREDFDLYYDDVVPSHRIYPLSLRLVLVPYFVFYHIVKNASVLHIPFSGGPLGATRLWRWEAQLLHYFGIKVVVLPVGYDAYLYSQISEASVRHVLLSDYRYLAFKEEETTRRVKYWLQHADAVLPGSMIDGFGRWDITQNSTLAIDTESWRAKDSYSSANGVNATVRILHTPNHRAFKGTEFLLDAVARLRAEGLKVELVLLEGVKNTVVQDTMQTVDILAEQFISYGYALNGIEGMASGLPVLSNLEPRFYATLFRRYSYLDECPVVSSTPETLVHVLRALVMHPELREQLGRAGRQYAEKYHSYETAQFFFGAVYDVILRGEKRDLMNLFHPLTSEYNRRRPTVEHPLVTSRLPRHFFTNAVTGEFEQHPASPERDRT